ncbi:restriction endonuclease [Nocardia brasiliensis]|nr:restriction endonuclease [Nocardia brasiliensis]
MARVLKIVPGTQGAGLHAPEQGAVCHYEVIDAPDGAKLVHLAVMGTDKRSSTPKSSASMQFDKATASELMRILLEADDLINLPIDWSQIDADRFELVLAHLLELSGSYTRITRLLNVNAPDSGRDIEAYLRVDDGLGSEWLERVVVQAKHWPARGVSASEIADLVYSKIPLWEGEPIRRLIMATTGSFTQDAVRWVDDHNSAAKRPAITLWSTSEIEKFLRKWPTIVADFGLHISIAENRSSRVDSDA